jgi:hypothetical protein
MKNLKFILLSVAISLFVSSCNKDIPKDIPDWLRTRIIEMKKENKKKGCHEIPVSVAEYQNFENQNKIYVFGKKCPFCEYNVYDSNGNFICYFPIMLNEYEACGDISFADYEMVRVLWTEKCK